MAGLSTKNKLHVSWSDSAFFPWLNETSVLDYFCDTRNPFYNVECNNQLIKMQGISPEHISMMVGFEYQLHFSQPPLYVIRKIQRTQQREEIPLSYYYILHGVVYQAPDLMSVLSSRLEIASHHLEECLETAFTHYKYNPSRGYYWDFNLNEETKKKDPALQTGTPFQRERVDFLLQEFANKFPPSKQQQAKTEPNPNPEVSDTQTNNDQPVEKKMKMNSK